MFNIRRGLLVDLPRQTDDRTPPELVSSCSDPSSSDSELFVPGIFRFYVLLLVIRGPSKYYAHITLNSWYPNKRITCLGESKNWTKNDRISLRKFDIKVFMDFVNSHFTNRFFCSIFIVENASSFSLFWVISMYINIRKKSINLFTDYFNILSRLTYTTFSRVTFHTTRRTSMFTINVNKNNLFPNYK